MIQLIKKTLYSLSIAVTGTTVFATGSSAGPALYFYYNYTELSSVECISRAYQALGNQSLQIPSSIDVEGDPVFAIGENQDVTVVIDCSEVPLSGRVTVMATANSREVANSYAQSIRNEVTR